MPKRVSTTSSLVGALIQKRREHLNLTRRETVKILGISEPFLVDIELRGSKLPAPPSFANFLRLLACKTTEQAMCVDIARNEPPWSDLDQEVIIELLLAFVGIERRELTRWLQLRDLRPGAMFVTIDRVKAVKTAHQIVNETEQPFICVLAKNGEHANFSGKTLVCEID